MHILLVFLLGCLALPAIGQNKIETILNSIENNNPALQAFAAYQKANSLELKASNNLPDPQFGIFYLPYGEHTGGDYSEYQIVQPMEFPTLYATRKKLIEKRIIQAELDYKLKRQEILQQAKAYLLELIYIQKRKAIALQRTTQARQFYEQMEELYASEQISILTLNKAKIAWLQDQFAIQEIEATQKSVEANLTNLNGGKILEISLFEYPEDLIIPLQGPLWESALNANPEIASINQSKVIAQQSLAVQRSKSLPDINIGYNSQGIAGERFSGIYGGLSIPLWNQRYRVQAAQRRIDYQQSLGNAQLMAFKTQFDNLYNSFTTMYSKYIEYRDTLPTIDSNALLLEAYEAGEISFLEYYQELNFFRKAQETFLSIQHQLYQQKNTLLRHEL